VLSVAETVPRDVELCGTRGVLRCTPGGRKWVPSGSHLDQTRW
jgi:hypothetical protein